jgi:hypothetical protein
MLAEKFNETRPCATQWYGKEGLHLLQIVLTSSSHTIGVAEQYQTVVTVELFQNRKRLVFDLNQNSDALFHLF